MTRTGACSVASSPDIIRVSEPPVRRPALEPDWQSVLVAVVLVALVVGLEVSIPG
jgi:hypothetical protein